MRYFNSRLRSGIREQARSHNGFRLNTNLVLTWITVGASLLAKKATRFPESRSVTYSSAAAGPKNS